MEALQTEQANLEKKGNLGKTVQDVQKTIDLLLNARKAIAADASSAPSTLAKLKNPVEQSFDKANDDLKTVYSALNKYSKAMDKKFKPIAIPNSKDPLSSQPSLINRAIAMHLLREGQFAVAATFIAEVNSKPPRPDTNISLSAPLNAAAPTDEDTVMSDDHNVWAQDFVGLCDPDIMDLTPSASQSFSTDDDNTGGLQKKFAEMYHVLHALRNERNLEPAIGWARQQSGALELRGSNLEFELCRLRFVELYCAYTDGSGPLRALEYARNTFSHFSTRYLREISALMGSLAFAPALTTSPYKHVFYNDAAWEDVASSFVREFCGMLGLSEKSPLYTAVTAGGIALPVLEKLERVMGEVGGQWTSVNELPVEIPLPYSYLFHSIFVCPVSKEQGTDENPPMMLPCGHVIAKESMEKISRGNKFKCPYCPVESHPRDARKVFM